MITTTTDSYICNGISVIKVENIQLFDINKVFDCGQCFRFDPVSDSTHEIEYAGVAFGKYISFAQDKDTVYIYNSTLEEYYETWEHFLGLDRDYDIINSQILAVSNNPSLKQAVEQASGIRILSQDKWETICSFIISQNNNIPRIKKLIAAICRQCGREIDVSNMEGHIADLHKCSEGHFFSFPSPESILDLGVEGLAQLKTGFRAKYIYDSAQKVSENEIDFSFLSSNSSTDECIKHLCSVKGIGPKVASCALLFGFERLDAFPIDVWIKKVIAKYFDESFDPSDLGQYAGIAQQYLFYYERYLQSQKEKKI